MPKKTRKQKIIADYRRRIRLLDLTPSKTFSDNQVTDHVVKTVKIEESFPLSPPLDEEENIIKKYFFHDLKKSMVLIGLIITIEIIFYFVSIKNYFGLG